MPLCNFWSIGNDHRTLLSHLLAEGKCRILESYSANEKELIEFHSLEDFQERFGYKCWEDELSEPIFLQLYPHDAAGSLQIRQISLRPEKCGGATFRYCSEGWGLVQLYLTAPRKGELQLSFTKHNSEKRAHLWESTYPDLAPVADWNWKAIESFSRRFNRFIQKCSVEVIGSQRVLPSARDFLVRSGKLPNSSADG